MIKHLSYFWVTAAGAVILAVLRLAYTRLTLSFWESMAKGQDDPEKKKRYGKKATDNSFQLMFHLPISIYGYYVIRNSPIHHRWIGGTADMTGLYEGSPFHEDRAIFFYCLISWSYQLQGLLKDLFFRERMSDYEIVITHHVAANVLTSLSVFGHTYRFAAVILFLSDLSDVPVAIVRWLDSLQGYKYMTLILGYFPLLTGWAYLRLMYLPWLLWVASVHATFIPELAYANSLY